MPLAPNLAPRDRSSPTASSRRRLARLLGALDRAPYWRWPSWVVRAPVAARAIWQGARWGDLSLPMVANPQACWDGHTVSASKSALFRSMGDEASRWVAPWIVVRHGGDGRAVLAQAMNAMERAGLGFPIVAKPDRGSGGAGVQLVTDQAALSAHLAGFPPDEDIVLQRLAEGAREAGIMVERRSGEDRARIVGVALKDPAAVIGDGRSAVRALIERHPDAVRLRRLPLATGRLDAVPAAGERVELAFARNRGTGGACRDGDHLVTPALEARMDAVARAIPGFHIGRLDVRFNDPARLRAGEGFEILEVNVGMSEPLWAWDPRHGLLGAWRIGFEQVDRLFEIGAANQARGHHPPGTAALLRAMWRQQRRMRACLKRG